MRNRTPSSVTVMERYEINAKSLKKGDSIQVGTHTYTVKSNVKNDYGQRVLTCRWGTRKEKDEVMLIVPKNVTFNVRRSTHLCKR